MSTVIMSGRTGLSNIPKCLGATLPFVVGPFLLGVVFRRLVDWDNGRTEMRRATQAEISSDRSVQEPDAGEVAKPLSRQDKRHLLVLLAGLVLFTLALVSVLAAPALPVHASPLCRGWCLCVGMLLSSAGAWLRWDLSAWNRLPGVAPPHTWQSSALQATASLAACVHGLWPHRHQHIC